MERPDLPTFVTVPEAARLTRLGRRQIIEAIERGDLCPVRLKLNGWPRLNVDEVRRWLAERGGSSQNASKSPPARPTFIELQIVAAREFLLKGGDLDFWLRSKDFTDEQRREIVDGIHAEAEQ